MSTVEDDEQELTRKQRRDQARAQRKEMEQAALDAAKRRTRLIQLGIVAAVVVVAIVAIVIATGGGSKSHGISTNKRETNATVSSVSSLLGGIPQSGNTLGNPKAPVTMQYFGDLQCPVCRSFTEGALGTLIQNYVRTGILKIEFRSLETATREQETFRTQQVAALAAGRQNKLWQYIELFYRQQGEEDTGYVTESYLAGLARQVPGLNLSAWEAARSDASLASSVTTDAQAANNNGFTGTPSFLLGKTGGQLHRFEEASITDPSSFVAAIEKARKS
jgi:protein-disulfide isomerase